ncbi:DUF397 domain-containing protein [Nonomuraea spiralis]|uniref:DUF397 domain-containing protein n=1 Tax=Nonomuraea spiralis TaxID=46182 RepID=A0ABV5IZR5_9ACTN|nr:DUF397 domain-containing protein [Nonomuraea spiralis]GGT16108.1 transcriptional regulator [Nonomuraea spiralis]
MAMDNGHQAGPRGTVAWVKSAYSGGGGDCVQLQPAGGGVVVRDSKVPDGQVLWFSRSEWVAFLAGAKDGQFDHLIGLIDNEAA